MHEAEPGLEYRFVPDGPLVSDSEWQGCLDAMAGIECDYLMLSGSLPRNVPADFCARRDCVSVHTCLKLTFDRSTLSRRVLRFQARRRDQGRQFGPDVRVRQINRPAIRSDCSRARRCLVRVVRIRRDKG